MSGVEMQVVYCPSCGLLMFNGFCLHGSVDDARKRREGK